MKRAVSFLLKAPARAATILLMAITGAAALASPHAILQQSGPSTLEVTLVPDGVAISSAVLAFRGLPSVTAADFYVGPGWVKNDISVSADAVTLSLSNSTEPAGGQVVTGPMLGIKVHAGGSGAPIPVGFHWCLGDSELNEYCDGCTPGNFCTTMTFIPGSHLAFETEPGQAEAGHLFTITPRVGLFDGNGTVLDATSGSVSLGLVTSGAAGAVLGGPTTRAMQNGKAAFPLLAIDRPGTGYRLRATYGAFQVDSQPFDVVLVPYDTTEMYRCLRLAAGLVTPQPTDVGHLDVDQTGASAGRVDIRDATRLLRKVAGLDANP